MFSMETGRIVRVDFVSSGFRLEDFKVHASLYRIFDNDPSLVIAGVLLSLLIPGIA